MSYYPVKWFTSDMAGAPRCSGTPGDLIALLDACLINGFNINGVLDLSVISGIATATFGTEHGYVENQIVTISGSNLSVLNGEKRVLSADTYTITFEASELADGSATGTIDCRTTPAGGWEKVYSDTQKAAYRSSDVTSTRLYLRVDDTGTQNQRYALVRGYENMSDVDTGLGPFPTTTQRQNGYIWYKSTSTDTTARPWALVGDSCMFYLFISWKGSSDYELVNFGDIVNYSSTDNYHCLIHGNTRSDAYLYGGPCWNGSNKTYVAYGLSNGYIARHNDQSTQSIAVYQYGSRLSDYFGRNSNIPNPNPVGNIALLHTPVLITYGTSLVRGHLPGAAQPLIDRPFAHGYITTAETIPGKIIFLNVCSGGAYALDITGPWR